MLHPCTVGSVFAFAFQRKITIELPTPGRQKEIMQ